MAISLIAVLLTLLLSRSLPELIRWRDFSWLHAWQLRIGPQSTSALGLLLTLGLPVLICALLQVALQFVLFGLVSLVFAIAALFYCWGPRDLDRDIEAVMKAPDRERRLAAAQDLRPDQQTEALAFESQALVQAVFQSALKRWFGVLLWFVIFGAAGALLYRLTQLLAYGREFARDQSSAQCSAAERLAQIFDWAPSHLVVLALALASDFDAVFRTWRDYHAAHKQGYFTLDLGFLDAIARASVNADVEAGDGYAEDVHSPLTQLDDAHLLLHRVLIIALALIAIMALTGWMTWR
jgi:AmpE protein